MVAQRAHALRQPGVVRGHGAALPGGDDLARMEGEAAEHAEPAAGAAAVRRAERAGGVLDQRQLRQLLEPRRPAEQVHGEDRLRVRRDAPRGVLGIDVHRHRVDVDEHGPRAHERDDVRGRRERVRGHEHLVARPDPGREHADVQRRGPGRDGDGVLRAGGAREQPLELLHLRPHRQLAALDHGCDLGELLLAGVGQRQADYVSAGLRLRYHAIVLSSPSSSSTFASKPSCSRAFSTFGMRSSTSA